MNNHLADASWIWCHDDVDRLNQYALFRRRVTLPAGAGRVVVHACADMRYWLHVNGARVGFGPGKFDPPRPLYNSHDVTALVRPGENVVAFKVHSIGPVERCSSFMPTRAGLIAAVTWNGGAVVTDGDWRACEETAYAADTPRFANHQSFIECFDARRSRLGWQQPDYDDADWSGAYVLSAERLAPWGPPAPSPVGALSLIPRTPCRVVETGRSIPAGDWRDMEALPAAMDGAERLPGDTVAFSPQTGFWPVTLTAPAAEGDAAYAVFDFAENSAGYLAFRVRGTPGTIIDLGYSEDFRHGRVRCNLQGVRYVDRFVLGDGALEHQLMFPKTLRYLLVEVRGGRAEFERIGHDVSTRPVRWQGGFTAPEQPSLSQVWRIGAHTVQLCMEDVYMDTPRRERAGWLGDMIPEAMAAYYAFGDYATARHALDLYLRSQQSEGWVVGRFPSIDGPNFPTWSASFSMGLADYARHSGDVEFIRDAWPGVRKLTAWFERQRQPDDLLIVCPTKRGDHGAGGYILVDWAPTKLEGAVSVMNMFYHRYLADAAWCARLIGDNADAARLDALAARTKHAVQTRLFDDARGIFTNGRTERGLTRQAGYQENLLALLWDLATPAQAERIGAALLPAGRPLPIWTTENRNWLTLSTGTEPWDEEKVVPVGSPFFMYYALGALFETGRAADALLNIETHYGGLLAQGETSIWEDFSGDTSRSHGWGAAPTVYAGKYVLGVEPLEPGFRRFSVLPAFAGLERASGRVPTPHGTVDISWQRDGDAATMSLSVPDGAEAFAGLPAADGMTLRCDGEPCDTVEHVLRRGRYLVCTLGPGRHELELKR